MTRSPSVDARDRCIVVDGELRIRESNAPGLNVGDLLTQSSWLGSTLLDAVGDASRASSAHSRVGRDDACGTHWLVRASLVADEPRLVRVLAIDATPAVSADRAAVLGKIVHSMQNISFALQSVADAIDVDRPTGPRLDEHLVHVREPARRLSVTMTRLNALLVSPALTIRPLALSELLDHALARTPAASRPRSVTGRDAPMTLSGDVESLSEAIVALLECEGKGAASTLAVDEVAIGGSPFARIAIDRRELVPEERAREGVWDIAGGQRLETALRLALVRTVVLAHQGTVSLERTAPGRVRLALHLPVRATD